ncbi:MAG: helix-turn-helix domain-containing protein [Saccharofermentans sp.]|nr:helix-turn-helix domain-containing protein [Saccharofermentans sp.]
MVENLRILRNAKGMSQQQLADAIGVSQQAIQQYETDKVEPDLCNLIRISDVLGVSVDYLIAHEPVTPDKVSLVNDEEYDLIEGYRTLPTSDKKIIKRILDSLAMQ